VEAVRVNRACGFCSKREWQVSHLVEGTQAFICNECVDAAATLLRAAAPTGPEAAGRSHALPAARAKSRYAFQAILQHFEGIELDQLVTTSRVFPVRMRADLQRALDAALATGAEGFHGLHATHAYETQHFAALLEQSAHPVSLAPPRFEEVDIGESEPVRCVQRALWLRRNGTLPYAVYLTTAHEYGETTGVQVEIAVPTAHGGDLLARELFERLEDAISQARSYRGKVLSLEAGRTYSGRTIGVSVHRLAPVRAEEIILPEATLALLERNVIRFAQARNELARLGMPLKKGLLFHGPPGTGKSYTVRYLAGALPDHTTLLMTAEQMGILPEYIALARLLQPSILVIEDADLIARERSSMNGPCEESLLNRLLNEMDGLREDARIFFVLTTNRPETLEPAIASRPGRIDQAIEFPLPDALGRRKLATLYARGLAVPPDVLEQIVLRTERTSAAFVKELMRRAAQEHLEQGADGALTAASVERALSEMLFAGGRLNLRLLGGDAEAGPAPSSGL
jgi:hypothetical protein